LPIQRSPGTDMAGESAPAAAREPVRIGVIGGADIARRRLLPAFAAEPGCQIMAIASRDAERARELAGRYDCAAVTGYERLLADPRVEAVYVPLPIALHAEWIERALLAGKHVLGEKPLTSTPAATARLYALAGARGLVLVENFMFRHHSAHARVRELLAQGTIGQLRHLTAVFAIPPPPPGDIRYRPDLGGGALLDIAVQPLFAVQHFLGPRVRVCGASLRRPAQHQVDTGGAILLAASDGVTAQVVFGMEHGYRAAYELWGSSGRITVERAYAPPADYRPVIRLELASGTEELVLEPDDQVRNAVRAFSAAIRERSRATDWERSVALAQLLADVDAADRATAARRPIGAPPADGLSRADGRVQTGSGAGR